MLPLNCHHLYYFWSAVKAGSISGASRGLMLSQPALSLQLRQLEKALGAPLLRRQRSGVTLTARGRLVFARCERIFAEGEALAREVRSAAPEPPALRVGAAQTLSREVLLRLLEAVTAREVRTVVVTTSRADLRERLGRGALDAAVSDADFSHELGGGFRSSLLASLPVRLVASPSLARRLGGRVGARPDLDVPVLLRAPESPLRPLFESLLSTRRARYHAAAETNDAGLLRELAVRGRGVAALSAVAAEKDLRARRLVPVDGGRPALREQVWLVVPSQAGHEPVVTAALERLARGLR